MRPATAPAHGDPSRRTPSSDVPAGTARALAGFAAGCAAGAGLEVHAGPWVFALPAAFAVLAILTGKRAGRGEVAKNEGSRTMLSHANDRAHYGCGESLQRNATAVNGSVSGLSRPKAVSSTREGVKLVGIGVRGPVYPVGLRNPARAREGLEERPGGRAPLTGVDREPPGTSGRPAASPGSCFAAEVDRNALAPELRRDPLREEAKLLNGAHHDG
jgi:hypothetical protein